MSPLISFCSPENSFWLLTPRRPPLARRMREVEGETASLAAALQDRQRKYERGCEKLAAVRDISRTLAKCHMLLNEVIRLAITSRSLTSMDRTPKVVGSIPRG